MHDNAFPEYTQGWELIGAPTFLNAHVQYRYCKNLVGHKTLQDTEFTRSLIPTKPLTHFQCKVSFMTYTVVHYIKCAMP